jgi:type II secretory pathway pseudopilin PulG
MEEKNIKRSNSGFSLIESLLSLSLFLFILVGSFEFFISIRNHFFELKNEQEINQAAYATLDKIRLDICESGRGLVAQQTAGLLEAIQASGNTLTIQSKDKDIPLGNKLIAGQTFIPLAETTGMKKGQELCIADPEKGELKTIVSVTDQGLLLDSSLNSSYEKTEATAVLIRTVSFHLEADSGILRRKVNASPAQPLLEDVLSFDFAYTTTSNIISLSLILKTKEEKEYEISVFPKNMALASNQ